MSFVQETSALSRVTADKLGKHDAINRLTNARLNKEMIRVKAHRELAMCELEKWLLWRAFLYK